ncbi:ATP-binding cassette sub-family G member 4 [Anthonomus grandis grandis]|uniref:ATP-binding cassette sub-family G member 4 n=1 Tax=Anthonomus grandis grandis TaxID=2921223 RepID=UPI002166B18E|nr:ATP-binding cassette sub-family G member 4 [Anthonomus grandis grandis]XP_050308154.1 ATP-binding cassette sub-family G member 4 [Anthonomus grandis grandis]XP_050308155.1 ATP-binding cassette sub-family G member 4 [Anthonomus grandis grandis]XP_050308156.1 ATP-binding cassette sub-family G member 4 [Anthonomus grandis grandis]XP_050308157.1 ATP-binding cassette sub-family G member 4 [Anthonomus grandis grandis]
MARANQINITLPSADSEDQECVIYNAKSGTVYSPPESLNNASVLSGSQSNLCNGTASITITKANNTVRNTLRNNNAKKPNVSLTHLSKRPPVDIQFTDLKYSVSEGRRRGYKTILKGVNGKFKSGELTGIMGPSGAGKSTLMNILAGYRTSNLEGSVLINNKERSLRRFRKMSCYIMQDDCLQPHLTVQEAMTVSANLKIGKNVSNSEKKAIINEVMEILGLSDCKHTPSVCLSGGQRKRLSIALELVNNPPVMFFDEPTSGLDSSSCFQCLCLLKSLARGGRTIICTIHQPSARLFEMFDNLYMLAEGQCIYRGPVMNLVPFLSGMNLNCPSYHNPADYVMEVACGEHGDYVQKLVVAVNAGRCNTVLSKALEATQKVISNDIAKETTQIKSNGDCLSLPNGSAKGTGLAPPTCTTSLLDSSENLTQDKHGFPTSGFHQFLVLFMRSVCIIFRDKTLTRLRLVAHFIVGILIGAIFYGIGNDAAKVMSNAGCLFFTVMFMMFTAMMPTILTFPLEMSVFVREHLNYWYSLKAYYFAKTLADIPFQIALTTCYIVGVYFITDQPLDPTRFFMFLLIAVLTALVSQSFGLLVGAAFNIESGVFLGPISTIPMVLFSGFFAKLQDIPFYFQWLPYLSYVKYSFEGTMVAIYGLDRPKLSCTADYCHFKYPKSFLEEMSFKGDMMTYFIDIAVLSGLFVFLRILAFFVLRIKLFQNR